MYLAGRYRSILFKRTDKPGSIPTKDQLEIGEIGLNTHDGILFFKNSQYQLLKIKGELVTDEEYREIEENLNTTIEDQEPGKYIEWFKKDCIIIKGIKNLIWKFKGEKV